MTSNALIQTPARKLAACVAFYTSLGFKQLSVGDRTVLSDGRLCIEANPSPFARTGLKLMPAAWNTLLDGLREVATVVDDKDGHVAVDPNGVFVYLSNQALELPEPGEAFGKLGNFAGLSIETADFEASQKFWSALGYEKTQGDISQGWLKLSANNGVDVSLMTLNCCPHLFPQPGLTYFNGGKNPEILPKIKQAGVAFSEEITCFNEEGIVDNAVIHDPGFTGFFIFND